MRARSADHFCQTHRTKMELLHRICLDSLCRGEGLLCHLCESERHAGHNTYQLMEVQHMVDNYRLEQDTPQEPTDDPMAIVKSLKAKLANELTHSRNTFNTLLSQVEKASEQYFKELEQLLEEQSMRVKQATPTRSEVNFEQELSQLNKRVVELVGSHMDFNCVKKDVRKRRKQISESSTNAIERISTSLAQFTQKFNASSKKWTFMLSTYHQSDAVTRLYDAMKEAWYLRRTSESVSQDFLDNHEEIRRKALCDDPKAMFLLGLMNYYGYGVTKNAVDAKMWMMKTSEQGGQHYCWLFLFFLETDNAKRRQYLLTGAGLKDFGCLDWVGTGLGHGIHGFSKDLRRGKYFLELSAEQGYPHASYQLGKLIGVQRNPENPEFDNSAQPYFRTAAELGHRRANEALGRYHMQHREFEKAAEYFFKAHSMTGETISGQGRLEHDIGVCLRKFERNMEAEEWFKIAAKNGYQQPEIVASVPHKAPTNGFVANISKWFGRKQE